LLQGSSIATDRGWDLTALGGKKFSGSAGTLIPAFANSHILPKSGEIWGTLGSWSGNVWLLGSAWHRLGWVALQAEGDDEPGSVRKRPLYFAGHWGLLGVVVAELL
jgi:hypothetical protein